MPSGGPFLFQAHLYKIAILCKNIFAVMHLNKQPQGGNKMQGKTTFRAKVLVKDKEAEVFYTMHTRPSSSKTCGCKSAANTSTVVIVVKKIVMNGTRLSHKDHTARAAAREVRNTMKDGGALCESCLGVLRERALTPDSKGQTFMTR